MNSSGPGVTHKAKVEIEGVPGVLLVVYSNWETQDLGVHVRPEKVIRVRKIKLGEQLHIEKKLVNPKKKSYKKL